MFPPLDPDPLYTSRRFGDSKTYQDSSASCAHTTAGGWPRVCTGSRPISPPVPRAGRSQCCRLATRGNPPSHTGPYPAGTVARSPGHSGYKAALPVARLRWRAPLSLASRTPSALRHQAAGYRVVCGDGVRRSFGTWFLVLFFFFSFLFLSSFAYSFGPRSSPLPLVFLPYLPGVLENKRTR